MTTRWRCWETQPEAPLRNGGRVNHIQKYRPASRHHDRLDDLLTRPTPFLLWPPAPISTDPTTIWPCGVLRALARSFPTTHLSLDRHGGAETKWVRVAIG